jgi:hypothetical protein
MKINQIISIPSVWVRENTENNSMFECFVGLPPFSSWASLQKAMEVLADFHNKESTETREF